MSKEKKNTLTFIDVLQNSGAKALGGGIPGAAAMGVQILTLMWLRTTMNYQYRHGTTTTVALKTLYSQGGIRRFYRGVLPALIQGPLSRFGDTAANTGIIALLDSYQPSRDLPISFKTLCASLTASIWRIGLMPVDTLKTILQVEGKNGLFILKEKYKKSGIPVFYHGAIAASSATFVGHFPWFFTYNKLNEILPEGHSIFGKLVRNASLGFCASIVSDTSSNSIRVVKTTKQTSQNTISYLETIKLVIREDGWTGLFGRGLRTRILTNALQGMMFSVLWKGFQDIYTKKS